MQAAVIEKYASDAMQLSLAGYFWPGYLHMHGFTTGEPLRPDNGMPAGATNARYELGL
jgi:hypothetical protein